MPGTEKNTHTEPIVVGTLGVWLDCKRCYCRVTVNVVGQVDGCPDDVLGQFIGTESYAYNCYQFPGT